MMDERQNKETLLLCLQELKEAEETLVAYAEKEVKASVKTFVSSKIGKLFRLASVYKDIFERLGIQTKDDFEEKIKHHFRYSPLREAFEEWQEAENKWDDLLKDVDSRIGTKGPHPLTEGQQISLMQMFIDARTGTRKCLYDFFHKEKPSSGSVIQEAPSDAGNSGLSSFLPFPSSVVLVLLRHFA
ncbi:uncharacterized protein LOC112571263 [Pomacea canaliculata]|uniref:uncharacterized protein LOC112571263 n=1 Tax=Pomacea canaliculata TaxID=400727 RepID=UPI000D73C80B|nr:uncharacterized protein LOC112571263 [Pomacea canaliculata]XP_025105926.1 uncharacterized protein LOC112571263 [Pomacea canaliculata]